MDFRAVSPMVLQYFDAIAGFEDNMKYLFFCDCIIPPLTSTIFSHMLVFDGILHCSSLKNLFDASWPGTEIQIARSPGFDDDFLQWFMKPLSDGSFPAQALVSLRIEDCWNFTPRALLNFVELRKDARAYIDLSVEET